MPGVAQAFAPDEIKALRESSHVSDPVFARYLNSSESTVQKWETGAKRAERDGAETAVRMQKHGLEVLR
ncbi:hypothetical protein GCM10007880_64110 [Mesorhizobium amorphae]|nr:hypothetical protein GCM10007880_64110 [Mesorhizobium amorphae]